VVQRDAPRRAEPRARVYGLPEIYASYLAARSLSPNPGCYPQTAILGPAPLRREETDRAGWHRDRQQDGVSGARAHAEAQLPLPRVQRERDCVRGRHAPAHAGDRAGAYGHRGRAGVGDLHARIFMPMDRGYPEHDIREPTRGVTGAELTELYRGYFAGQAVVRCERIRPRQRTRPARTSSTCA